MIELLILIVYLLVGIFLAGLFDVDPDKFEFVATVFLWPLYIVLVIACLIGYFPYKFGQWLYSKFMKPW